MRKSKTVKLADREFTIKELLIKDVYFLLEDVQKIKKEMLANGPKAFEHAGSKVAEVLEKNEANIRDLWRTLIPDLRKEDFLEFSGDDINKLITEVKEINRGFFLAAKQLWIPQLLGFLKNLLAAMSLTDVLRALKTIWTISWQGLISSAPAGTPESSNTDTVSS